MTNQITLTLKTRPPNHPDLENMASFAASRPLEGEGGHQGQSQGYDSPTSQPVPASSPPSMRTALQAALERHDHKLTLTLKTRPPNYHDLENIASFAASRPLGGEGGHQGLNQDCKSPTSQPVPASSPPSMRTALQAALERHDHKSTLTLKTEPLNEPSP